MYETYQGEIVHFLGGLNNVIGEIEQKKHPNGQGWVRILNPCILTVNEGPEKGVFSFNFNRIWGADKRYKPFVDIFCPQESLKEVRVLDPEGIFYKTYKKEVERISMDKIVAPGGADISNFATNRHDRRALASINNKSYKKRIH